MRPRLVLGLLFLATLPARAEPDPVRRPWDAGLAAYRAKKFDKACPLLEQAAKAAATNGAIWADLGLCEHRRGRRAASLHASHLAVKLGDESARKAAYFNLGLAGVDLAPDGAFAGRCGPLKVPAELACPRTLVGCGHAFSDGGGTYGAASASGLLVVPCEGVCPANSPFKGSAWEREPDIALSASHTIRGMGDSPPWTCGESDAVEKRATACAEEKGAAESTCEARACADATLWQKQNEQARPAWPELQEELESWDSLHECKACGENTTDTSCRLVSIDPVRGRAGLFCTVTRTDRYTTLHLRGDDTTVTKVWPPTTEAREIELSRSLCAPGAGR